MTRYYLLILVRRTAIVWLLVRIIVTGLMSYARMGAIHPVTAAFMPVLVVALILIDARISGEEILLANFGIGRGPGIAVALVVSALLEWIAQVVL